MKSKIFRPGIIILSAGLLLSSVILSCSESPIGQTPTNTIPPPPLTNVRIEPTYGGAHVTYTLPDVEDISYVKCEFEYNGKKRTVRSSVYKNYLDIEGIGAPEEIEVKLSLINHSEVASVPHIEKFIPLDPPMTAVFNSFNVEPAFGGVKVIWENPARMMAGISFLAANDYGELELKDMVFSTLPFGMKSLRGFNTDKRLFALSITDKYENLSDTFKIVVTPLYEIMLNKRNFSEVRLTGDNASVSNGRPMSNIWDGNLETIWHTLADAGYSIPQHFTIDLGVLAQLTRIVVYNRGEIYYYGQHNLRRFDIWGTNELLYDRGDPIWDTNDWKADWKLLANCEIIKPSGSPVGTNTPEDIAAQDAGFEFEFTQEVSKMRYIRFEVQETWARTPALHIAEISVYGDDR